MNEILLALLLGLVEGLTEFIPVSSTGHLILAGDALSFHGELADTFDVFIQLGAILAVVILYRTQFLDLLKFKNQNFIKLGLATLPALLAGVLFYKTIKTYLFDPFPVAIALILGGFIMIWVEAKQPSKLVKVVSIKNSILIGLFQIISMWPGISRSGSTIVSAMYLGIEKKTAADFSFMLSVPVISAAVLYDLYKSLDHVQVQNIPLFAVGFLASFIFSIIAIKFFLKILVKFSLRPFAYYRIVLGILVLCL